MSSIYKYLLIAQFTFSFSANADAQNIQMEWVRGLGSSENDEGRALVIDSNKAVIVAGEFRRTVDFDAGPGTFMLTSLGAQDIFITEYDSSGNFRWAKSFGGVPDEYILDMKMDKQGNLILTGIFQSAVDFDPGPGVYTLTTATSNTFILKLDNNGNFIWAKQLAVQNCILDVDHADNIFLAGEFGGTKDFDPGPGTFQMTGASAIWTDMFVEKLDNNGNFIWAKQVRNVGDGQHQQFGLESDPAGNIFFAGAFNNTLDFDPGAPVVNLTPVAFNDGFILKLDGQGNFAWVRQIGGAQEDKVFGLEVDDNGNVFSTGMFAQTVDFDPGPGTYPLTSAGPWSCFISKLDGAGNFVWAKGLQGTGESIGQCLAIDSSGNVYVSGMAHYPADFDPGPGTYTVPDGMLFTEKLDPAGNFRWAASYTSTTCLFSSIYSAIKVDIMKNVYFTGSYPCTVDFDPNLPVYNMTPNSNSWDAYIHKLSQCRNTLQVIDAGSCGDYTLNGKTYSATGTYYQTLTNSTGCDSIIELNLTVSGKLTQQALSVCDQYLWNGHLLTSSGIYRDTFHLPSGCDSIAELTLTINKIQTDLDASACDSYNWNGSLLTHSGIYTDTFSAASGCDSIVNLSLTIKQNPQPYLGKDTILCKGDKIVLSPGTFSSYLWNDNSANPVLQITNAGTYWVRVTGANQCEGTDSVKVALSSVCPPFFIPTGFTPNGDGRNDVFKPIISAPVTDYRFSIFNRWGQKIFQADNTGSGWDGKIQGVRQDPAVFVYLVEFSFRGMPFLFKGTFALIR
ncbi:MAG: gliding motility-associated C-terminal domain-containing protein [Chitinophagaceae bacterium]